MMIFIKISDVNKIAIYILILEAMRLGGSGVYYCLYLLFYTIHTNSA